MQSKTMIFAAAALVAATALASSVARFRAAGDSVVTVTGTSTLHDWTMRGSVIRGAIDIDALLAETTTPEAWKSAGEKPATVVVTIPVTSIRSEHAKMDALMEESLKAKNNPEIRYELTAASILRGGSGPFVLRTSGRVTIAGISRDVTMDIAAAPSGERRYVLSGETPIRMTDFGIKPPAAMFGTIRTGNDVRVAFRWTVDRIE